MILIIRKKTIFKGLAAALSLLLLCGVFTMEDPPAQESFIAGALLPEVIIDAGHGGEDGGAVAADGTVESAVNLQIAQRLREVFWLLGIPTAMTREEDVSLALPELPTIRERKRSDLQRRVEMVNALSPVTLISIHQNSLPQDPSVHGAQAFYNEQQGAEMLAAQIQDTLNTGVNTHGEKRHKPIGSGVYLMKNVRSPAVLVECGFLSHREESVALQDPEHQTALAVMIAAGYLRHKNTT